MIQKAGSKVSREEVEALTDQLEKEGLLDE